MRRNNKANMYLSCIRKCGRDTLKEDGICPECYEKDTPPPAEATSLAEEYCRRENLPFGAPIGLGDYGDAYLAGYQASSLQVAETVGKVKDKLRLALECRDRLDAHDLTAEALAIIEKLEKR